LQKLVEKSQKDEASQKQEQQVGFPPTAIPPAGMPMFPGFPGGAFPGAPPGIPPMNPTDAWQEFTSPDGRKYYYNMVTQENTWNKPKALIDKEQAKENGGIQMDPAILASAMSIQSIGYAGFRPSVATGGAQQILASSVGSAPNKGDKTRPVSSNAVAGTPWCVVWTGDNRVFFYNPSTRTSVWERPPDLYNRPDVDLLVSKPPPQKQQTNEGKPQKRVLEVDENDSIGIQNLDGDSDDEVSEESAPEAPEVPLKKKSRQEKKAEKELQQKKDQQQQQKIEKAKQQPLPIQEKPIDPAIQAELHAQEERNKMPLEERLKKFRELLEDKKVSATSTWEKELSKIVFDPRYLLLSAIERKAAFEAYTHERSEIERAERKKRAKEAKEGFKILLEETKLHGKSTFSSFSSKYGKDSRFKAVDKMRDREDYFKDHVEALYKKEKEEKRKEKEKAKDEFRELLVEQSNLRRRSIWAIVKKTIDSDSRYKSKHLDSDLRQKLFDEHAKSCPEGEDSDDEEESKKKSTQQSAEEIALEDRKREVEEELGEHLKERSKEHERHKFQEHEQHFKALLADLIKNTDTSWHDARKQLRKDERYQMSELLDKDAKEKLFKEHITSLERKKRDMLYQLLNDHEKISFTTRWRDAKKLLVGDERVAKFRMDERKLELEYRDWMERRHNQVLEDFEALLRETKIITYKSQKQIQENEQHLKDILAVLENDKRYLLLNDLPQERERQLENYLSELDRKGPPPPPTTNPDPDRRRK